MTKEPLTIPLQRRVLFLSLSIILFVLLFRSYIASLNMWRGEQYLMNQKYDESISAFKKAALLAPQDARVYSFMGWLYTRAGRKGLAMAAYRKALKLDPQDSQSLFELGLILFKEGKFDGALASFEKAARFDKDNLVARIMIAVSWEKKGNVQQALEEWKEIKGRFPREKSAQINVERLSRN